MSFASLHELNSSHQYLSPEAEQLLERYDLASVPDPLPRGWATSPPSGVWAMTVAEIACGVALSDHGLPCAAEDRQGSAGGASGQAKAAPPRPVEEWVESLAYAQLAIEEAFSREQYRGGANRGKTARPLCCHSRVLGQGSTVGRTRHDGSRPNDVHTQWSLADARAYHDWRGGGTNSAVQQSHSSLCSGVKPAPFLQTAGTAGLLLLRRRNNK